jgi:hypothetical protein
MKQLLAKYDVDGDLPNLSTIIEIPTCQEPDAVGVEEIDPKLGEEPMLGDTLISESTLDDTRELCAALSDGVSLPPLLIVEPDMFDISVSTFDDHRVFKVDCDHLDIIDDLYANFCSIPESRFVCISDTKIKQYSVGCDYSLLFKKNHWDDLLDLFKPKKKDCKLHDLDHLDRSELYITAMFTYGDMEIPQWPHIDYRWDFLLLDNRRRRGVLVDKGSKGGLKQGFICLTLCICH